MTRNEARPRIASRPFGKQSCSKSWDHPQAGNSPGEVSQSQTHDQPVTITGQDLTGYPCYQPRTKEKGKKEREGSHKTTTI